MLTVTHTMKTVKEINMDIQTKNEYFHYLNELRDADDEINMYGAEPFLMRDFHMSNREASKVVQLWKNSLEKKND